MRANDALSVLPQMVRETRIALGGRCSEMLMQPCRRRDSEKGQQEEGDSGRTICTRIAADSDDSHYSINHAGYNPSDHLHDISVGAQYEGQTDASLGTCSVCMHRAKHAADND